MCAGVCTCDCVHQMKKADIVRDFFEITEHHLDGVIKSNEWLQKVKMKKSREI